MIARLRLLIAWGAGTVMMTIMSFLWHGVILNDITLFKYSVTATQYLSIVIYSILGGVMVYKVHQMKYRIKPVTAFKIGIITGTVVFIVILSGFPFGYQKDFHLLLMDLVWQWMEQTLGAITVLAIYKVTLWRRSREFREFRIL